MRSQNGFSSFKGLSALAIVGCLIFFGWFIWQQPNTDSTKAIDSFEACAAAGNPIRESYPEQCVTDGQTFANPNQTVQPVGPVSQGLKGTITVRGGNCMPTIGPSHNSCVVESYTTPSEVIIKKSIDPNNKAIKEVVKKIENVKGSFEVELQPGLYNLYVSYQGGEYCNLFGGRKGEDCEFRVEANKVTDYTLQINNATD